MKRGNAYLAFMALGAVLAAQGHFAHAQTLQVGTENTILTLAQRQALGFFYGPSDGSLGARWVPKTNLYEFFVSGAVGTSSQSVQGTFRLAGDLSDFNALISTTPSLTEGGDPNGSIFDRDYAGGGTYFPIEQIEIEGPKKGILLIYHGEYHPGPDCNNVPWFYAGLGLALSTDEGKTFQPLGQIVQPTMNITQWQNLPTCRNVGIGYGTLVLGDDKGGPLDPAKARSNEGYLYVFYEEMDPPSQQYPNGLAHSAVARAKRADVITAAFSGNTQAFPTLFQKYDNGTYTPATGNDPTLQTSAGASSALQPPTATQMSVLYDRTIHQFLMAYVLFPNISSATLWLQISPNLFQWPGTCPTGQSCSWTAEVPLDSSSSLLGYPSLIGEGHDPLIGQGAPVLFYTSAYQWFPDWASANTLYVSRQIQIIPAP